MSESFTPAPGGGIVPQAQPQNDSRLRRVATRASSLLPRLPERIVDHIVLSSQKSTRPPKKVIGGIPVVVDTSGTVPCTWLSPELHDKGVLAFLHGGSYVGGPFSQQWAWCAEIQRRSGFAVVMVLYRMPPTHPFPAALDDALAAIRQLHGDGRLVDGRWILGGDSAGGGLALATAQALRDVGGPLPAGLVLTAPWVDVAMENPDMLDLRRRDLAAGRSILRWAAERYADGVSLDDPRLSPINARMNGLPPVHLNVGTEDILLADIRRLRIELERAGVPVSCIEQEGAGHTYPQQVTTSEAEWTIRSQVRWILQQISVPCTDETREEERE